MGVVIHDWDNYHPWVGASSTAARNLDDMDTFKLIRHTSAWNLDGYSRKEPGMRPYDIEIHTYTTDQLRDLIGTKNMAFDVAGIPVDIQSLLSAGWTCRIAHSRYGGRSKISFYGGDRRSYITFRTPNQFRNYTPLALLTLLSEQTLYQGKMSVWPKPLQKIPTDEELLNQVESNIKKRLVGRRKPKPIQEERLARFVGAA